MSVVLKAFLSTVSGGKGGYHKVVAFTLSLYSFIYLNIYPCIYIYIHTYFFYSGQVFTLAILVVCSALCQCACSLPEGSLVEQGAGAVGPGT